MGGPLGARDLGDPGEDGRPHERGELLLIMDAVVEPREQHHEEEREDKREGGNDRIRSGLGELRRAGGVARSTRRTLPVVDSFRA